MCFYRAEVVANCKFHFKLRQDTRSWFGSCGIEAFIYPEITENVHIQVCVWWGHDLLTLSSFISGPQQE